MFYATFYRFPLTSVWISPNTFAIICFLWENRGRNLSDYYGKNKKGKDCTILYACYNEIDRYKEYSNLPNNERKRMITESLAPKFKSEKALLNFIDKNIERKDRNRIERRKRLQRKINLQQWNYFCTFTYDNQKHTEESFKKSLMTCLHHQSGRRGWKYVGVWERSPENHRLHFHAIMYIPEGGMIGKIITVKDYDTRNHRMQETFQNTHFLEKFGRNDFQEIVRPEIPKCIQYLTKYIEKSGEKLIYSRKLPTYFVSDVLDDDVICGYGVDEMKFILADDFLCIDEGEIIGKVSPEVIDKMPKAN